MRILRVLWIFALAFSACSWLSPETVPPQSLLTPYVTLTPAVQILQSEPTEAIMTPTPELSPTPFVHVLAASETISSIALTYELEVNDILAINPEITPNALSVGTEIMIPGIGSGTGEKSGELAVISEPLALEISEPECSQTAENGLWCVVVVKNSLGQSANGITLTFALKNNAGDVVVEQTVPALLNSLASGDELPVAAYFSPPIPAGINLDVSLKTALPQEEAASDYLTANLKINSIETNGRTARISAVVSLPEEAAGAGKIWVALIAYDRNGSIVGVRRMEYLGADAGEEGLAFKAYVYSNSEDVQSVKVLAEVIADGSE